MRSISKLQVTIPAGQALSSAADLRFADLLGVNLPSAWDAAPVTLQFSVDGVTFRNVKGLNGEYTFASPAANDVLILSPLDTLGARYVIVRSGSAATPVNQTASRTLELVIRELN